MYKQSIRLILLALTQKRSLSKIMNEKPIGLKQQNSVCILYLYVFYYYTT